MQFTHDIGIIATKQELKAILGFARDSEDAKISFRVRDGALIAWTASSIAAVYHHGLAFNGSGKRATEDRDWHVTVDILRRIEKGMDSGDEVVLHVNRALHLTEAEVRTIEDSQSMTRTSLDNHVSEQIDLSLPNTLPTRPALRTGEIPTSKLTLSMTTLLLLKDVAKAAGTEANRFLVTSNPTSPVYVEVDKPKHLADEDQAAWVCVLMPMVLNDDAQFGGDVNEFKRTMRNLGADVVFDARVEPAVESDPIARELMARAKKDPKQSKQSKGKSKKKASEDETPSSPALEDLEED